MSKPATYLLVHGAWHGGWCWRPVADRLRAKGHEVYTPTLTGCGERKHLARPDVNLSTHIADIAALFPMEDLADIILVGHSYGGYVVTGIADRFKDKIRHIVYLDAGVPEHGQSVMSNQPNGGRGLSPNLIDGHLMPVPPPTLFGISADDKANIDWLSRRLTPHPYNTWLEPLTLNNGGSAGLPRTYIHCVKPNLMGAFDGYAAMAKADKSWKFIEMQTGHNAMVTAPDELAKILLALA